MVPITLKKPRSQRSAAKVEGALARAAHAAAQGDAEAVQTLKLIFGPRIVAEAESCRRERKRARASLHKFEGQDQSGPYARPTIVTKRAATASAAATE